MMVMMLIDEREIARVSIRLVEIRGCRVSI